MTAVIAQTLRPHVRRFGGELAVHDAGLRAIWLLEWCQIRVWGGVACDVARQMMVGVPSKWFRQWQSIQRPSFWQSVVLCFFSSRFCRFEHQTRWTCTALWPRSVALRIRSLPHEVLLAQLGIGDAAETTASVHALLLDDPPRAVVTVDDDEEDLGTDIRMQTSMRTASNQARKHWCGLDKGVHPSVHVSIRKRHSYQLGTSFLQLSVLDLHSTFEPSCFWNL